jgi:predicted nucleic-acid-binding Zn-ribbon protein
MMCKKLPTCKKCNELKKPNYKVCPRCGFYEYSDGEIDECFEKVKQLNEWRNKNPLFLKNVG